MQLQAMQRPSDGVAFGNVAPRETSTPHVAAAAFYHCLGELMNINLGWEKLKGWQCSPPKESCASIR